MERLNFTLLIFIVLLVACESSPETTKTDEPNIDSDDQISIVTNVMDFVLPDTIESGWNTFRYENKSTEPHFFMIEKYPEGKTIDSAKILVMQPFQKGMNKIMMGKGEEAGAEFAKLPAWFADVQLYGGSGILSSGGKSYTTIHVPAGKYILECYMKMAGGVFHSSAGMLQDLVVVESNSSNNELQIDSDVKISISSAEGIEVLDTLHAGNVTFEVFFKDQKLHENFAGHDINLAEITSDTDLKVLEKWMNWAEPDGLLQQPPTGVTFMGGANNMTVGDRAYFTAKLEAGKDYVLVSEVPNTIEKKMMKVIHVTK